MWETLLGFLVGGLVTGFVTWWLDHQRWKRSQEEESRQARQDTYSAFLTEYRRVKMAGAVIPSDTIDAMKASSDAWLADFSALHAVAGPVTLIAPEELSVVATKMVTDLAERRLNNSQLVGEALIARTTIEGLGFQVSAEEATDERPTQNVLLATFLRLAREDLGVSHDHIWAQHSSRMGDRLKARM